MKKTLLIFALAGALTPYAFYYCILLFSGFFQTPSSDAVFWANGIALILTDVVLIWALWKNPKLQGKQWMLTGLTLAFTPACGLPLYFYFIWNKE